MPRRQRIRHELRDTLSLALPLIAGQLCAVGLNVVEILLAGANGGQTLAAVGLGAAVWSVVILGALGLMLAVPPSVAQLVGAGRQHEIAPLFRQALWLALVAGVLMAGLVQATPWLLARAGSDPAIIPETVQFLMPLAFGAPAQFLFFFARGLSDGLGLTRPTMWFSALGVVVLAPLGHVLMSGAFGLPAMGAFGLGLAYAITLWLQAGALLLYLARHRNYRHLGLFERFDPPRWRPIASLLAIALPMGFAIWMEGGLFVATAVFMSQLGPVAMAAHPIALNVASVAFMIPMGIALAITVRVGHAVGRDDVSGVRHAGFVGIGLVLVTQCISATVLALASNPLASIYTDNDLVLATAVQLLVFAAIFQLSDGIQVASNAALRGLKDTRIPALMAAFSYWGVGMTTGWWLTFRAGMGPAGLWLGLIAGLSVASVLLFGRFALLAGTAGWKRLDAGTSV